MGVRGSFHVGQNVKLKHCALFKEGRSFCSSEISIIYASQLYFTLIFYDTDYEQNAVFFLI